MRISSINQNDIIYIFNVPFYAYLQFETSFKAYKENLNSDNLVLAT